MYPVHLSRVERPPALRFLNHVENGVRNSFLVPEGPLGIATAFTPWCAARQRTMRPGGTPDGANHAGGARCANGQPSLRDGCVVGRTDTTA